MKSTSPYWFTKNFEKLNGITLTPSIVFIYVELFLKNL